MRDAWNHRARSLLVVLAVALGLTGSGAVLNAWALVRTTTEATYAASHPVAATMKIAPLEPAFLARVRQLPGIGAVRARRTVVASLQVAGSQKTAVLYALDDVSRPDIGRLQDVEGPWPPADGSVMIERSSLGYSDARVDGEVSLAVGGRDAVPFKVSGLVRDVSVAPGWMDHLVYCFVSQATLSRLGVPTDFDELQFTVTAPHPSQEDVRQLAWRVKALAAAEGRSVGRIDVPVPGQHVHAAQIESLTMVQGAFGVLALVVCGFLIFNLVSAMLAGQRRELGIMKAIGAREGQLAMQVLLLAALLGVLASAIALPLAALLGRLYGGFQGELLNFPVQHYAIPAWAILLQTVVGIGLPVLAAAWPVANACRQPVTDSLREIGLPASTTGNRARRWLHGFPVARPQLLSLHNAFRQRLRCCLSLLALAFAGAVFVGAGNLRIAVQQSVALLFNAQHFDMVLRASSPQPVQELLAGAATVAGVAQAEAWGAASAGVLQDDGTVGNAFDMMAVPVHSRVFTPVVRDGRWLQEDDLDGVVVGTALLKSNPGIKPGQQLRLIIGGRPVSLRVVGIADSGIEAFAYVPQHAPWRGTALASLLLVQAKERSSAAQQQMAGRLRSELESHGIGIGATRLLGEARQAIDDHLQMVVAFLGMMGWVMIVVGGMGLASTMSVAVMERRREIGVLRAMGAGRNSILGMVQLEGLVMALLGWLLSLPLSIPVSKVLGEVFGRVMFEVPTSMLPEPASALRWLALVAVVSLLACAWPARQALRMPVVRALQYE